MFSGVILCNELYGAMKTNCYVTTIVIIILQTMKMNERYVGVIMHHEVCCTHWDL